jgi:hypothetical protein
MVLAFLFRKFRFRPADGNGEQAVKLECGYFMHGNLCRDLGLSLLLCAALLVLALGAGSAAGALSYAHSVLGLGFAAVAGLSGRYSVLILLGDSSVARMGVDSSGSLTIAANGLTARVFDAICT